MQVFGHFFDKKDAILSIIRRYVYAQDREPSAISHQRAERCCPKDGTKMDDARGGCPKDGTKMDDEAGIELRWVGNR